MPQKRFENPTVKPAPNNMNPASKITATVTKFHVYFSTSGKQSSICKMFIVFCSITAKWQHFTCIMDLQNVIRIFECIHINILRTIITELHITTELGYAVNTPATLIEKQSIDTTKLKNPGYFFILPPFQKSATNLSWYVTKSYQIQTSTMSSQHDPSVNSPDRLPYVSF